MRVSLSALVVQPVRDETGAARLKGYATYTPRVKNVPAFAIVRLDDYMARDEDRFTITRIVWRQDIAESEVQRLNKLNADKDCRYIWQATRAQPPSEIRRGS
jgi:hypothetical protein